ncbi:hypothetical protein [Streptomyces sp. SP17KL33]|uniref:hypothetical protein n=1 Tax=Streptomyces sp. SP17KL33 TaxID=3002534 RepID=UPI002E78E508|nr:hypothetical protein [Streptomyces sp. SP17KL33]MEE1831741.1 hypothetical protein [Streptomyces sp. SP17KL33]
MIVEAQLRDAVVARRAVGRGLVSSGTGRMSSGAGCRESLEACWWRVQIMIRGELDAGWIHAGAAWCGLRRMVQAVHAGSGCMAGGRGC